MKQELDALIKNQTWELVPPNPTKNIVSCKWLFRIKRKADGSIDRYKTQLVAKGFTQRPSIDFHVTFTLVVKPTTVRIILYVALRHNWNLRQLDVNNAFLQDNLDEEVYMAQPLGFTSDDKSTHICRLRKTIYGLKQAPRAWYNALTGYLSSIGFSKTKSDASLLIRQGLGDTIFVLVYVDDIIVTRSNTFHVDQVIASIASQFSIKDLGNLHYFLGVEVIRSSDGLILTQANYVNEILNDELMTDCKNVHTPMSVSELITLSDGTYLTDATRYHRVLGRLQYLSFTRPDIAYAVNKLSQFMQAPSNLHWKTVKRVLRYLHGTIQLGLRGGDIADRVSTSGYILFLGHNPISWSSKKQNIVSRSSTESEYRTVANALSETLWVTDLLIELCVPIHQMPTIYCDNLGATFLSKNPVLRSKVKHAAVDFHFVRHHVDIKKRITNRHLATAFKDEARSTVQKGADAMKQGADTAKRASQEVKNETASVADEAIRKTKAMGDKVADTAQDIAGKAKTRAQQTWETVKDSTLKIKDTVKGKAEESTEAIKDNVNKSMNTKN
ncbi:hypothetical protein FXO37_14525 [Capsicum annuum]|nr:hypothetical protein FXO37_14525 [Capsicum annuum]